MSVYRRVHVPKVGPLGVTGRVRTVLPGLEVSRTALRISRSSSTTAQQRRQQQQQQLEAERLEAQRIAARRAAAAACTRCSSGLQQHAAQLPRSRVSEAQHFVGAVWVVAHAMQPCWVQSARGSSVLTKQDRILSQIPTQQDLDSRVTGIFDCPELPRFCGPLASCFPLDLQ